LERPGTACQQKRTRRSSRDFAADSVWSRSAIPHGRRIRNLVAQPQLAASLAPHPASAALDARHALERGVVRGGPDVKITAVVKRGPVDRALAAGLTVDRIRDGEGAAGQGVAAQGAGGQGEEVLHD
jgi:hypothetical protein